MDYLKYVAPPRHQLGIERKASGVEVLLGVEPRVDFIEQFLEGLTAVVGGDLFVHLPSHSLDGVRRGSALWQEVQSDPPSPSIEIFPNESGTIEGCVVADHVGLAMSARSLKQVIRWATNNSTGSPRRD